MEISNTVLAQVGIMFLLIAVGFFCYKKGMINEDTGVHMSEILLMIVTPAVLIKAFQIEFNKSLLSGLLLSFGLAVLSHIVSVLVSIIIVRKDKSSKNYAIERFACVYGNAGFMGIPLISAVFPENGVFYASAFLAVFNIFMWTHGVTLMSKKKSPKELLKVFKSPPIIGIAIGLILFVFSIKLPPVLYSTVSYISDLNTPLAMIVTGIYIAKTNLLTAFTDIKIYKVAFARLLLIPLIMVGLFTFIKFNDATRTVAIATMVATACPSAASTLLLAAKFRLSPEHGSKIIAATTVFSIITMPLVMFILDSVIGKLGVI